MRRCTRDGLRASLLRSVTNEAFTVSDPKLNAQCAIRKAIRLAGGEPLAPHRQDEIDRWRAFTADVRQGMAVSMLAIKYCIALSTASCYASRARAGWINTRVRGSHSQTKQRGRGAIERDDLLK